MMPMTDDDIIMYQPANADPARFHTTPGGTVITCLTADEIGNLDLHKWEITHIIQGTVGFLVFVIPVQHATEGDN